jgi:hypothetical protein
MICVVKRERTIEKKLRSKFEWACTFSNCVSKINNGDLRMFEKSKDIFKKNNKV